jgi:hypothetical protein
MRVLAAAVVALITVAGAAAANAQEITPGHRVYGAVVLNVLR